MGTPIPALCAEVVFAADQTIGVTGLSTSTLSASYYYYFISSRAWPASSVGDGYSLLARLWECLEAASGYTINFYPQWNVASQRVSISHNSASPVEVTIPFGTDIGFAANTFTIANGVTVTATNAPRWYWTPNMPVSETGPTQFDPALTAAVPSSTGAAHRAPDGTTAYQQTGVQYDAEYTFLGIDGYWRVYPQVGYERRDLFSFWRDVLSLGRRVLWWRDQSLLDGVKDYTAGAASPYNCIVYVPNEQLRATFPAGATSPGNNVYWDVSLGLWLSEAGETPPT